jgi:TPR repeat protein
MKYLLIVSLLICSLIAGDYELAQKAQKKGQDKLAIKLYEKAATGGNIKAQVALVDYYAVDEMDGSPTEDPKKYLYWLQRAAEGGHPGSQFSLGFLYKLENSTTYELKQDLKKAEYWFQKSAEGGNAYGQSYLADIYFNKKDFEAARLLYEKAATQRDDGAYTKLVFLYGFSDLNLIQTDAKKALYWFNKGHKSLIANGNPASKLLLDLLKKFPNGVLAAAQAGNKEAQFGMGIAYSYLSLRGYWNDAFEKTQHERDIYWLKKAAAQGHKKAKLALESDSVGYGIPGN